MGIEPQIPQQMSEGNQSRHGGDRLDVSMIDLMSHLSETPDSGQQPVEGCLAGLNCQQLLLGYLSTRTARHAQEMDCARTSAPFDVSCLQLFSCSWQQMKGQISQMKVAGSTSRQDNNLETNTALCCQKMK